MPSTFELLAVMALQLFVLLIITTQWKKRVKGWVLEYTTNFRLSFDKGSLALSAFGIIFVFAVNWFLWSPVPARDNLQLVILSMVIIGPVFEEVVARGMLFGALLKCVEKRQMAGLPKWVSITSLLFLQAFIFLLGHPDKWASMELISANFLSGLIYGALFLLSKRNILPGIAAHAVHNYMTVIAGI